MSDPLHPVGSVSSCAPPQDEQPSKTPKLKRVVWDHFTKDATKNAAMCDHCASVMSCGGKGNTGTTNLLRHLEQRCPNYKLIRTRKGKSPRSEYVFDQESCRKAFAVAVIKHNYPFKMVEHKYFLDFLKKASPDLSLGCRVTLRKYVNGLYEEEKVILRQVLDPRFKMQTIEYYYSKIHGDGASYYVSKIRNLLDELFIAYGGRIDGSESGGIGDMNSDDACPSTLYEVEKWCRASSVAEKSELEKYLAEEKFISVSKLDVLDWWHQNSLRLPIMAKIDRDVLAIPASTVASESAFSVGGRVISESRSKLLGDAVESLVVGKDWIRYLSGSDSSDDEYEELGETEVDKL